jgi:AraC-like DNA-binding protein
MNIPVVHRCRSPRPPLASFVDLLWIYEGYVLPHARERLLPMATTELVIDLRASTSDSAAAIVAGPRSQYTTLETSAENSVVGVHFKPGGAFPFFGLPAGELHNAQVPLELLWGPAAARLRQQIFAATTPEAKLALLEQALLAVAGSFARHRAVAFALRQLSTVPQAHTVAGLADEVGMSQRSLIARFRDEVGLTPKLFARVERFQAVVRSVQRLRAVDWADVAVACGYFDQAHFIHDFKSFSGFTPAAYLVLRGEHQNHVPLPETP